MHKVLSVITVLFQVTTDNVRHKHKDQYQSFRRKGVFISLTVSMTVT